MDRDVGPPIEAARLGKHALGLSTHLRLTVLAYRRRNVVQEVRGRVKACGVSAAVGGRGTRGNRSGIPPPVSGGLARRWDHRVDEDQSAHAHPCTDQRGREATQRLRDEGDVCTLVDRRDDPIGVRREAGMLVVARQIDGDRIVPSRLEQRHYAMPIPRDTTRAWDENESGHILNVPLVSARPPPGCAPRVCAEAASESVRAFPFLDSRTGRLDIDSSPVGDVLQTDDRLVTPRRYGLRMKLRLMPGAATRTRIAQRGSARPILWM